MNFLSCNRLVQEKETQMNNRYHRVRLDEIKKSRDRSARRLAKGFNAKGKLQQIEKQQEISRENAILLTKLNTIIYKPNTASMMMQKPKQCKISFVDRRQPNIEQNSHYSFQKLQDEWKQQRTHSKIASKMARQNNSKHTHNVLESIQYSQNRRNFDEILELFDDLGLEKIDEKEFEEPENIAERIVFVRKAVIINEISYLIEISTAFRKIFLIAHNMMSTKGNALRSKMSEERAKSIFSEYNYDFDVILNNVIIEGSRISIRIPIRDKHSSISRDEDPSGREHLAYQKQTKFIRRNYYDAVDKIKNNLSKNHSKMFRMDNENEDIRRRFCSLTIAQPENDSESKTVFKHYQNKMDARVKAFSIAVNVKKKKKTTLNKTETNYEQQQEEILSKKKSAINRSFDKKQKTTKQNSIQFQQNKNSKMINSLQKELFIKNDHKVKAEDVDPTAEMSKIQKELDSSVQNIKKREGQKQDQYYFKKYTRQQDNSENYSEQEDKRKSIASPKSSAQNNRYGDDFQCEQEIDQVVQKEYCKEQIQEEPQRIQKIEEKSQSVEKPEENIEQEYIDDFEA